MWWERSGVGCQRCRSGMNGKLQGNQIQDETKCSLVKGLSEARLQSHDNISRLAGYFHLSFSLAFHFADIFHLFPFCLYVLSFIPLYPHTYATVFAFPYFFFLHHIQLEWWESFPIFFLSFIITLLNKTPSSDVWFQCCFFLSSVQFVLAHQPQSKRKKHFA